MTGAPVRGQRPEDRGHPQPRPGRTVATAQRRSDLPPPPLRPPQASEGWKRPLSWWGVLVTQPGSEKGRWPATPARGSAPPRRGWPEPRVEREVRTPM